MVRMWRECRRCHRRGLRGFTFVARARRTFADRDSISGAMMAYECSSLDACRRRSGTGDGRLYATTTLPRGVVRVKGSR